MSGDPAWSTSHKILVPINTIHMYKIYVGLDEVSNSNSLLKPFALCTENTGIRDLGSLRGDQPDQQATKYSYLYTSALADKDFSC